LTEAASFLDLLSALPRAVRGDVVVKVKERGSKRATTFTAGRRSRAKARRRRRVLRAVVGDREVAASVPADARDLIDLWQALIGLLGEREQLRADLEGIDPTSVKVLEEASIWDELRELQHDVVEERTEEKVAETGLKALVRAASVRRALYVRWHSDIKECEVLADVVMDRVGGLPVAVRPTEPSTFVRAGGIVDRALAGNGTTVRVDDLSALGAIDGPERLATRCVFAVPVRYGVGDGARTLGVLLVMDGFASDGGTADEEPKRQHEMKLADAMAVMLGSVLGTRRVAAAGKELETARTIHRQIQAPSSVDVPGFEVFASNQPCGTVGGDYFDFVPLADGRTLAAVMDVSGHNLASGMLMVSARTSLRLLADRYGCPARVLTELARAIHGDLLRTERFISAVGVALAPGSRRIEVVNAGHLDTLVLRAADRSIESLAGDDVVFGFVRGVRYSARPVELQPGDVVLLYTDGVIETTNADGEMFGNERLADTLRACAGRPPAELVASVLHEVDRFRGATPIIDDVTVLAIRAAPEEGTS